jgi:hypothetical protein
MIRRSTWLALAAFALILVFSVWWSRRPSPSAGVAQDPAPEPLWTFAAQAITAIRVQDTFTGLTLEVRRDPASLWTVIAPASAIADVARIERAAAWLAAPTPQSRLEIRNDPALYGLDVPSFSIAIDVTGGETWGFDVGRPAPIGSARYVRLHNQDDVFVFSQFGLDEVLGLLTDLLPTPTPPPSATPGIDAPSPNETSSPSGTSTP